MFSDSFQEEPSWVLAVKRLYKIAFRPGGLFSAVSTTLVLTDLVTVIRGVTDRRPRTANVVVGLSPTKATPTASLESTSPL
jgi:hypothetical protein